MLTALDDPPLKWPLIVSEEEEEEDEGDDGYEGEDDPHLPQPLPAPESPYWSTDDGSEEEE